MKINFEKIALRREKRWKCGKGYWHTYVKTVEQTINPWNRNKAGVQKSEEEILAELRADLCVWQAEREMCRITHKKETMLRDCREDR